MERRKHLGILQAIRWRVRRDARFATHLFRRTQRVTSRQRGREFPRLAYIEVHTVLRYIYLIIPLVYIPFCIYDIFAYRYGWSEDARMIIFDSGLYLSLVSMNLVLSGNRPSQMSLWQLRFVCTLGVGLFSLGGTVATMLLFDPITDLSLFGGILLAIAVLFRFPDHTKFYIYAFNYLVLYAFFYYRGVDHPILLQNPMFILCVLLLFDRVTFISMSNSYFRNRRIVELNRLLLAEDRNKSEMIGIAIHDLKSPVTGIMSVSKLLRESPDGFSANERDEILGEIQESSRAILGHIEDLVDIARSGIGGFRLHYDKFDVLDILYSTVQNFNYQASLKEIQVYTRFTDGPLLVRSDRQALARIFENLLSNAIKYTPPGGSVLLQTRVRGESVHIEICDEGPGFSAEDRSRLFGQFRRLSARPTAGESSTGIGLYTVYKLVQLLDDVSLDLANSDIEGDGAKFTVTLNLVE